MQDIRNFIGRAAGTPAPTGRPAPAQPTDDLQGPGIAADGLSPELLARLRERRQGQDRSRCHPGDDGFRAGRPGRGSQPRPDWEQGARWGHHHHHGHGQWMGREQNGPWMGRQQDGPGRPWARRQDGTSPCPERQGNAPRPFGPRTAEVGPNAGIRPAFPPRRPEFAPDQAPSRAPGLDVGPGPALGGDFDGPENLPTANFAGPTGPETDLPPGGPMDFPPGFDGPEGPEFFGPEGPDFEGPDGPDFEGPDGPELQGPVNALPSNNASLIAGDDLAAPVGNDG